MKNKIMKIRTTYLLILTLFTNPFFAFTCRDKVEGGHKYITFINNTRYTVYVAQKPQIRIDPNDTLYDCNSMEYEIISKNNYFIEPSNNYWETDFKVRNFVMYFVYPHQTSFYDSCEDARKHQLKRYQLTKEDLDRMNWIITYP
jgi:hypothetical protein